MRQVEVSVLGTHAYARALERLAPRYGWTADELDAIRTMLELRPEIMNRYWRNLAIARNAGFLQSQENGFLTLRAWCVQTGRGDPTWSDLERD